MIVTRLMGGLGNQMFQYAFGLYHAQASGQPLFIDDSGFEKDVLREPGLDHFKISASRLTDVQRKRVPGRYRGSSRVREACARVAGQFRSPNSAPLKLRREKKFGFQQDLLRPARALYLDGYWQSQRYFPGIRAKIIDEFTLAKPLSIESAAMESRIRETQSVAIHVRRGDYVSNPAAAKIYRCLDANYYRACLGNLQKSIPAIHVFLFSDDIDWCLQNLRLDCRVTPVAHNDASTAHEDLYLISCCQHAVIANSTFSWWGAYLGNESPDRHVYCPARWFHPGTHDDSALNCRDWISEVSILPQSLPLAS